MTPMDASPHPVLWSKNEAIQMNHPGPDESRCRLHAAGWSIGEAATAGVWLVFGCNGGNLIKATGKTQAKAWHRAVEQAEAVGMASMKEREVRI
jgi:hypothetical protein